MCDACEVGMALCPHCTAPYLKFFLDAHIKLCVKGNE
jgi:hypothetical protein